MKLHALLSALTAVVLGCAATTPPPAPPPPAPTGEVEIAPTEEVEIARDAPDVSRANIEVRIGPDGKVLSVRVLDFSGKTAEAWERVAQLTAKQLAQKQLATNEAYPNGATIYVNVTSGIDANQRHVVKMSHRIVANR